MTQGGRLARPITDALRVRKQRAWGAFAALTYLIVYLFAIRDFVVSLSTDYSRFVDVPSVHVVPDWSSKVFKQQAAFFYESVVAIYPADHVKLLISPANIAMGALLAVLVGANVAMAIHLVRTARACRRTAFTGLLGALPGFLGGFACCVPTVALVVGAQFTVALIALRSWFFPLALASLALSLLWNAKRAYDVGSVGPSEKRPEDTSALRPLSLYDGDG